MCRIHKKSQQLRNDLESRTEKYLSYYPSPIVAICSDREYVAIRQFCIRVVVEHSRMKNKNICKKVCWFHPGNVCPHPWLRFCFFLCAHLLLLLPSSSLPVPVQAWIMFLMFSPGPRLVGPDSLAYLTPGPALF